MSQKTPIQIIVGIDKNLQKTIELHSEAKKIPQEEVAYSFMLTGAINDTTQKIIQTELYKGTETIRGDLKAERDSICNKLKQLEQQIDKLELLIDKILEKFD